MAWVLTYLLLAIANGGLVLTITDHELQKAENVYNVILSAPRPFPGSILVNPLWTVLMVAENCSMASRKSDWPGEPEKRDRAGITVLGGITVLSAILAQSFIVVNLPWKNRYWEKSFTKIQRTIMQFLPISTWFPIIAASTTVFAPMWTWSPIFIG